MPTRSMLFLAAGTAMVLAAVAALQRECDRRIRALLADAG